MNWIRPLRKSAELSQEEVAKLVGVNRATITKIENGKLLPSVSLAKRIGSALGFDWTRFYEDEPEEAKKEEVPA